MRRPLIVIGGGEHARVVIEAARTRPECFEILGFTDEQACEETSRRLGLPRLGDDNVAIAKACGNQAWIVIGVGNVSPNAMRANIVQRFPADAFATVVHADASVSTTAQVATGAVVLARAVVASGARVGAHAIINHGAIVEHDVVLGDFVHLGPAAAIGGGTKIGAGSYLGLGSRIRDHVQIGRNVLVGMGAVVIGDVTDGACLVGFPARPIAHEEQ
jgi:acetyltransferase EpsM